MPEYSDGHVGGAGYDREKLEDVLPRQAGCGLNRKMLAEMAARDPEAFDRVVEVVKQSLPAAAEPFVAGLSNPSIQVLNILLLFGSDGSRSL